MSHKYLLLLILFSLSLVSSGEDVHKHQFARVGNFLNEITPSSVFGFGQDTISKNQFVIFLDVAQQKADTENLVAVYPSFLYGITNALSLYVVIPTIPKFRVDNTTARGLGNISAQLEYAFYQGQTPTSYTLATIVGTVAFPNTALTNATSSIKDAFNAFGNYDKYNFFLGGTASYLSTDIYIYAAPGWVFNTAKCQTTTTTTVDMLATCSTTCSTEKLRNGDSLYYQFGIGHSLGNAWGATLLGSIEFNGVYTKKNTVRGVSQENSGGNTIFLGPTLNICSERMLLQVGIQLPVLQKLNGNQPLQKYQAALTAAFFF